jgi:catalase
MPDKKQKKVRLDAKASDLLLDTESGENEFMTTDQGVKINDDQNSLKAGERGATLLEDFILHEKITHFDHEHIPERIVHARGVGAHGYFQVNKPLPQYTKAGFLNDSSLKMPVFVRFSTVAGSRGSTDLASDLRGFSVKFYTQEGNYDLVGNNIPVFFIQVAIKFPDLIHAVKPESQNGMAICASRLIKTKQVITQIVRAAAARFRQKRQKVVLLPIMKELMPKRSGPEVLVFSIFLARRHCFLAVSRKPKKII